MLYVSPLKALATDVERNLRGPLVGIRQVAARAGVSAAGGQRRRAHRGHPAGGASRVRHPPARRAHHDSRVALPGPDLGRPGRARRGAHGDPRRDPRRRRHQARHAPGPEPRAPRRAPGGRRRSGPADRAVRDRTASRRRGHASWPALGASADGGRAVHVVQPPATKRVEVEVVVPVPDLTDLTGAPAVGAARPASQVAPGDLSGRCGRRAAPPVDLAARRGARGRPGRRAPLHAGVRQLAARRRTPHLPDERGVGDARSAPTCPTPAPWWRREVTAQSGTAVGVPAVLARAHHGSMSRAERTRTEDELKAGRLPAVVATSSLELGIDMGSVDLVVQVGAPPSVASGLQRIGRAGHQVGAVSRGVMFPTFRGELAACSRDRRADAHRADRGAPGAGEPARRARPADRRDGRGGPLGRRRAGPRGPPRRAVRHARRGEPARGARHARRALPERGLRRAATPAGLGSQHR